MMSGAVRSLRASRPGATFALTLAGLVLLGACTGAAEPSPTTPAVTSPGSAPSSSATPETEEKTPEEVESAVAGVLVGSEPAKVADGELASSGTGTFGAQLGVVSVETGAASSRLVFALRTTSGSEEPVPLETFNEWAPLTKDVRDVSVTDTAAGKVLRPFLGLTEGRSAQDQSFCLCSSSPKTLNGDWVTLYATLPPIATSTTTVAVDVPGFPTVADVPVTRS